MMIALVSLILIVFFFGDVDWPLSEERADWAFLLSLGLILGLVGGFILGIIALFQKGYKKTFAIISVVIGSIFAIIMLIGFLVESASQLKEVPVLPIIVSLFKIL